MAYPEIKQALFRSRPAGAAADSVFVYLREGKLYNQIQKRPCQPAQPHKTDTVRERAWQSCPEEGYDLCHHQKELLGNNR